MTEHLWKWCKMRLKLCCKELHKSRKKILLPLRYWKNLWNHLTYLPRLETRGKTTSNRVYDFSSALNVTSNAGSSWGTEIDWIETGTILYVPALRPSLSDVPWAGLCPAVCPARAPDAAVSAAFISPGFLPFSRLPHSRVGAPWAGPAGSHCCSRGGQRGHAGATETTQG